MRYSLGEPADIEIGKAEARTHSRAGSPKTVRGRTRASDIREGLVSTAHSARARRSGARRSGDGNEAGVGGSERVEQP